VHDKWRKEKCPPGLNQCNDLPAEGEVLTVLTQPNSGYSEWFVLVTAAFVTCLITANITAVKLSGMFDLVLPMAVIIFLISYISGDVLTEVYGYRQARQVIWPGFSCNIIAVVTIWLAQMLPAPSFRDEQEAYEYILDHIPRLLVTSLPTHLAGEFANSFVLAKTKTATGGR
jgi:uncharacterized integral membrane protein (TIGR00697 family)